MLVSKSLEDLESLEQLLGLHRLAICEGADPPNDSLVASHVEVDDPFLLRIHWIPPGACPFGCWGENFSPLRRGLLLSSSTPKLHSKFTQLLVFMQGRSPTVFTGRPRG